MTDAELDSAWRKNAGLHDYHVTYYYFATGMENGPDERDFGVIMAQSEAAAKAIAIKRHFPRHVPDPYGYWFLLGCLSADKVKP